MNDTALITYTYAVANGKLTATAYGNDAAYSYSHDQFDLIKKVSYKALVLCQEKDITVAMPEKGV